MSGHSLHQQLQAIDFCIRLLSNSIKPSKREREFISTVLESIRWRIEQSIERERGR